MSAEADLSKFQLDVLSVLAASSRPGKGIEQALEEQYDEEIPHGRVYQNLDQLVEVGLVEKYEKEVNGRTHLYALTERGTELARLYFARGYQRVSRTPDAYTAVPNVRD